MTIDEGESVSYLTTELAEAVVTVTINRPPVNAVTQHMYAELRDVFTELRHRFPSARAVILRSEGKNFCGGNDLEEFLTLNPTNSTGRMQVVREAFWAIRDCPLPVIAAVQGAARGTGIGLATSSDLIVCSQDATFGLPEVRVGVMGGGRHLARIVPQQQVRRAFLTGDPLTAEEVERYGGVCAVVPVEELMDAARALAARIVRHSAPALILGKRALNQIEWTDLKSGYELEQGFTGDLSGTPDSIEARRAAKENRAPSLPSHTEGR